MKNHHMQLLTVENLTTSIPTRKGIVHAVDNVSFSLNQGETLAIVGESGSGKSVLCRSILGILPGHTRQSATGRIIFKGQDLQQLSKKESQRLRGKEIAMILQDPMSSLNPVMKIGKQIGEPLRQHLKLKHKAATKKTVELLYAVGMPQPEKKIHDYPHQLSGGMQQRVVIAMALACDPKLLIADEPTTALDVTVQTDILHLLHRIQTEQRMGIILVTHDLGVVAGHAHQTAVMYGGTIVELAPTQKLFKHMRMPYTRALIDSIPRLENPLGTRLKTIEGQPPDLTGKLVGCRFAPRCSIARERCFKDMPPLMHNHADPEHYYACWYPLQQTEGMP